MIEIKAQSDSKVTNDKMVPICHDSNDTYIKVNGEELILVIPKRVNIDAPINPRRRGFYLTTVDIDTCTFGSKIAIAFDTMQLQHIYGSNQCITEPTCMATLDQYSNNFTNYIANTPKGTRIVGITCDTVVYGKNLRLIDIGHNFKNLISIFNEHGIDMSQMKFHQKMVFTFEKGTTLRTEYKIYPEILYCKTSEETKVNGTYFFASKTYLLLC